MSSPSAAQVGFPVRQTSGFFSLSSVINDPPPTSNPLTMHLFVSNFSTMIQTVTYELWRLTDSGKTLVQNGGITAPVAGVGVVDINAGNFPGDTLEVVFGFTDLTQAMATAPSLVIFETFVADGATRPVFYVSTGALAFSGATETAGQSSTPTPIPSAVTVTNGMFDVPQGVAAILPKVNIVLNNTTAHDQLANVTINSLPSGGFTKEVRFEKKMMVPAGRPLLIPIDAGSTGIEGLASEIVLTLPTNAQSELLLEPSVNVTQVFTSDNTFEELLFIGPTAFGLIVGGAPGAGEISPEKPSVGVLPPAGADSSRHKAPAADQRDGHTPPNGNSLHSLSPAVPATLALLAALVALSRRRVTGKPMPPDLTLRN